MALFRYPGKKTWYYEFHFAGQKVRESAKTRSKVIARRAEQKRRAELEEGYHGLKKRQAPKLFKVAADEWLEMKKPTLAPKSYIIEKTNLSHLNLVFGRKLITDIDGKDISDYQTQRQLKKPDGTKGASPKTINLEIGTFRAILRRYRVWAAIQPDVKMLPVTDGMGKAITPDEEAALLKTCSASRSRSLLVAVTIALNTCMRLSEVRLLRWIQIDFIVETITVGKSKTAAGTGRVIPMTAPLLTCLKVWAAEFPERKPEEFVFPYERYGAAGDDFQPCVYDTDPTKPIGSWKEAWEKARADAKVQCRFHDLRHTGCTRMLEAGVPFQVVAELMGWSPATTIRMAKRYGHIGKESLRSAVNSIAAAAQKLTQKSADQPEIRADSFDNPFDLKADEKLVAVN
jgi:integrase